MTIDNFQEGDIVDCPNRNIYDAEILDIFSDKNDSYLAELKLGWDNENGCTIMEVVPLNELEPSNQNIMKL